MDFFNAATASNFPFSFSPRSLPSKWAWDPLKFDSSILVLVAVGSAVSALLFFTGRNDVVLHLPATLLLIELLGWPL